MELEHDACYQGPIDERDYEYSEVCGSGDTPEEYFIDDGVVQDQNKAGYPYGCVFFSNSQGINIMNHLEGSDVRSTGKELCDYAFSKGLFKPDSGAAIASGPAVGKELKYLSGYAYVPTHEDIQHSIANNRPVQVGSNSINWRSATEENGWVVSEGEGYGHSIILNGYSRKNGLYRIKQSYDRYDSGHQYLRFEDLELLYPRRYSLIDSPDPIITYRQKLMDAITIDSAKKAFEANLWNGERPQDTASREEVAAMIQRAIDSLK